MTRCRPPRLFDPLDLGALRHAVSVRDVLSLVVIGVVVAGFPLVLLLLGHGGDE